MISKSAFQIFAEYGGKQHALAERKKKMRNPPFGCVLLVFKRSP